jgi:hypothetical protein
VLPMTLRKGGARGGGAVGEGLGVAVEAFWRGWTPFALGRVAEDGLGWLGWWLGCVCVAGMGGGLRGEW